VATRKRPSYGFNLAGTAFGINPEAGVSKSMLAQLFPELNLTAGKVTDSEPEEVEKPDDSPIKPLPVGDAILASTEDDKIPGSEFSKYNIKGSFSYAAPFNVQVGPSGPQGRGRRLGYSASLQTQAPPQESKESSSVSDLLTEQKNVISNLQSNLNAIVSNFDYSKYGEAGFGLKDVEALKSRGVDEATLKRLAESAPMVGPGAAQQLGYAPTQAQRTESIARSYDPASAGGTGFGLKDVEALKSQGVSAAQMREIARRSPTIGEGARQLLGL